MTDQFVLWVERAISTQVNSYWIENLKQFGKFEEEPFAYFELVGDAVKWSVTLDNLEQFGTFGSVSEAIERILETLAAGGVDLRALPHYAVSKVRGIQSDNTKLIIQRFRPDGWLPDGTWLVSFGGERVSVYHVESGTVETSPKERDFEPVQFIRQYLSRLHPELLGTEEVAAMLGWDKQRVSLYWRTKRFAFPDLFVGGRPSWNEEKGRWEGGGRPFWRPETVEPWTRNPGV